MLLLFLLLLLLLLASLVDVLSVVVLIIVVEVVLLEILYGAIVALSPVMINNPIYLVWGCWVQLNSTQLKFFADHITFNKNGYMKHAHTRQRMTNNNNNKRKQVIFVAY